MGRKIQVFGELKKAYEDKKSNPECKAILEEATNKLNSLPKV